MIEVTGDNPEDYSAATHAWATFSTANIHPHFTEHDPEDLSKSFRAALDSLAEIHPIIAYELHKQTKLLSFDQKYSKYLASLEAHPLSKMVGIAPSKIKPEIEEIDDIVRRNDIQKLDVHILRLAFRNGPIKFLSISWDLVRNRPYGKQAFEADAELVWQEFHSILKKIINSAGHSA